MSFLWLHSNEFNGDVILKVRFNHFMLSISDVLNSARNNK